MTRDERQHKLQAILDEVRGIMGLDSAVLITRELTGPGEAALMLFTSGVGTTDVGRNMLGAGLTFFPDNNQAMDPESDGRQRLQ